MSLFDLEWKTTINEEDIKRMNEAINRLFILKKPNNSAPKSIKGDYDLSIHGNKIVLVDNIEGTSVEAKCSPEDNFDIGEGIKEAFKKLNAKREEIRKEKEEEEKMTNLSSFPTMCPEVLEAVHLIYEDFPEIETDCLLYLTELQYNPNKVVQLSNAAMDTLKEMGRCPYCGEPMQVQHYREPHPELDGCPMEDMYEPYCPNCDIGGGDV